MKDLTKKALSLANKNGQKFLKTWTLGKRIGFGGDNFKIIGIDNLDYSSNWFLVVYEYIETCGIDKGKRKVSSASISGYWSGKCKSTFFGNLYHVAKVHSEHRMIDLFGSMYAHHNTGKYQCYKAKCMELNRKYNYEPRYEW